MDPQRWLEALVGQWRLSGSMGDVELRQEVDADWALGERFVRKICRSTLPAADGGLYEAVYFIAYATAEEVMVMHLLDSSAVSTVCPVGLGRLEGSTVEFVFEYSSGPFVNRFAYEPADDTWRHDLFSRAGGTVEPFATKHLRRRRPAS